MKKTRYIPYGYTMQNGATVVEHSEAARKTYILGKRVAFQSLVQNSPMS